MARGIGLPPRPFLYTLDQISTLTDLSIQSLSASHMYFEGRTTGLKHRDQMHARNIAATGEKPDWRVAENELKRWFRLKGFKFYERSGLTV